MNNTIIAFESFENFIPQSDGQQSGEVLNESYELTQSHFDLTFLAKSLEFDKTNQSENLPFEIILQIVLALSVLEWLQENCDRI